MVIIKINKNELVKALGCFTSHQMMSKHSIVIALNHIFNIVGVVSPYRFLNFINCLLLAIKKARNTVPDIYQAMISIMVTQDLMSSSVIFIAILLI